MSDVRKVVPLHRGIIEHSSDDPRVVSILQDREWVRPARHVEIRPSLIERFADAFDGPFGAGLYVGFVLGCAACVAGAYWVAF